MKKESSTVTLMPIKHPVYDMYYAVYPDGTRSADFYNYTRALEHTKCLPERLRESKIPIARRIAAQQRFKAH